MLLDPGSYADESAFALEGVDVVAVTHAHADHFDPDRLAALHARNPNAVLCALPEVIARAGERWSATVAMEAGRHLDLPGLTVRAVGGTHDAIHPELPVPGNLGFVLAERDGVSLFHPGDSYAAVPEGVDLLAVPIAAPWARLGDTVEFVRRVAPRWVLPIHDAGLAPVWRRYFWSTVLGLGGAEPAPGLDDGVIEVVASGAR